MSRRGVRQFEPGEIRPVVGRKAMAAFAGVAGVAGASRRPARDRKPRRDPVRPAGVLDSPRVGRDKRGRLSLSMIPPGPGSAVLDRT